MKKNTILKVLSFVLLLTFVLSAVLMTGCGQMKEDIAKNQTDLEATNADLKSAKDEITKLQTALNELKEASATSEALSQQAAALQAKIDENKTALDKLEKALKDQETAFGGQSTALKELEAEIKKNADDIAALTEELDATKTALETATTKLGEDIQKVSNALDDVKKTYATNAALTKQINDLETVVDDLRIKVAALQDEAGVSDENVSAISDIIKDRLVKSDFVLVTDILFDEKNPWSIPAFKAGIVRPYDANPNHPLAGIAIQYEDEDIEAYGVKADLLADKLLRAIAFDYDHDYAETHDGEKDPDAPYTVVGIFELRDQYLEELVKIVDKFEAELVEWEPKRDADGNFIAGTGKLGFPSVVGDQLARLKYLHGLIVARDLSITREQESRYQALLAAVIRLARAEAYDLEIYEGPEDEEYPLITPANHPTQTGLGLAVWDLVEYRLSTRINLNTIKGLYNVNVAPLFANPEETVYYKVGMEDLPYYINYFNKLARYNELDRAKDAFEKKYPELTHFQDYNMSDPMLDAYDSIEKIDGAWLDNIWKKTYKLELPEEEVNCFLIIDPIDKENDNRLGGESGTGYGRILAIRHYVQTLHDLNEKYVKPLVYKHPKDTSADTKSLIPQIKVEIGVEDAALKVLWTHVPTLNDIFEKQDKIYTTIDNLKYHKEVAEFYVDFTYGEFSVDGALVPLCKRTMIGQTKSGEDTLAEIRDRVEMLEDTMADLTTLGKELEKKYHVYNENLGIYEWKVTLSDSDYINNQLDKIVNSYFGYFDEGEERTNNRDIFYTFDDQVINKINYDVMTGYYSTSIKPYLDAALSNLIEKLRQIYLSVDDIIQKDAYLPSLNKLIVAQAQVFEIVADTDITTIDFELAPKYMFATFFNDLVSKVVKVVDLAQRADDAAVEINEKIELLDGKFNLNKTAVVDETTDMVIAWAKEYLGYLGTEPEKEYDKEYLTPGEQQAYLAEIAQYFVDTEKAEEAITYYVYFVVNGAVEAEEAEEAFIVETVVNEGILNVNKYVDKTTTSTETYTFITGANFDAFKATQTARVERYNAAAAKWATIDMTPVANRADIDKSFKEFIDYVKEYYTDIVTFEDECDAIEAYYGLVGEETANKTAAQDLAEKIAAKMTYEDQWENGYRGSAASMALRDKAERFASYITGARFVQDAIADAEDYDGEFGELIAYEALLDRSAQYDRIMFLAELLDKTTVPTASEEGSYTLEDVLEELDEYTAADLDEIVLELMIQDVEELETVVRELKTRIADFCDTFDYFIYEDRDVYDFVYDTYPDGEYVVDQQNHAQLVKDDDDGAPIFALDDDGAPISTTGVTYTAKNGIREIYDDAKTAANGQRLDAELVAYVGAAKVYIINAFENDGDQVSPYYFYVNKTINTSHGETYVLPKDEAIVLTSYSVEMIQKACNGINFEDPTQEYTTEYAVKQVNNQLGIFRSDVLKDDDPDFDMYPEFDFDSENHFLKEEVNFAEIFADYPERPVRPEEMEDDDEWEEIWDEYLEDLYDWHVENPDVQKDLLEARGIEVQP